MIVIRLPPRRVTPELVHVAALLLLREPGAAELEVRFDGEADYRVGCGGRCDLVRDFDAGRNVHFAPFAALRGRGSCLSAPGPPAGLVGAAWAALATDILAVDESTDRVIDRAHELLFAPIDRRRPAPTLEPLLPGLRQLNWAARPEAVALAIRYAAATIAAMLDELVRRENVLMVEEDELWEAYARAADAIETRGPPGVMLLRSPSGAARHFLRRYDGSRHVLLVVMPASLLVDDPRHRVLAACGPRGRPLAPLVVPETVTPVRRRRPGHAELASLEDAERVVEATLQAYYRPRNYLTRARAFLGVY